MEPISTVSLPGCYLATVNESETITAAQPFCPVAVQTSGPRASNPGPQKIAVAGRSVNWTWSTVCCGIRAATWCTPTPSRGCQSRSGMRCTAGCSTSSPGAIGQPRARALRPPIDGPCSRFSGTRSQTSPATKKSTYQRISVVYQDRNSIYWCLNKTDLNSCRQSKHGNARFFTHRRAFTSALCKEAL